MFIRQNFITNSSSTGYVVWGMLVDKLSNPDVACEEEDGNVYLFHVSETQDLLCIDNSTRSVDDTSDFRITDIPNGVYPLSEWNEYNEWILEIKVKAEIPRGNEPEDYALWTTQLQNFIKKHNIKTYQTPHWVFVRHYD
jgi:hypothetical protein